MSEHRILVVDDDERVLFVLRRALLTFQSGYEIVTAQDGHKALDRAKEILTNLEEGELGESGQPKIARRRGRKDKLDSSQMTLFEG